VLPLMGNIALTSIASLPTFSQLFKRMLDQFDRLRKRNAFLEQYKKERIFENGLEEFDDARYASPLLFDWLLINYTRSFRATADELLKEYKACESPDYISYVGALPLSPRKMCNERPTQGSNDADQAG
jgi:tubulin gamma